MADAWSEESSEEKKPLPGRGESEDLVECWEELAHSDVEEPVKGTEPKWTWRTEAAEFVPASGRKPSSDEDSWVAVVAAQNSVIAMLCCMREVMENQFQQFECRLEQALARLPSSERQEEVLQLGVRRVVEAEVQTEDEQPVEGRHAEVEQVHKESGNVCQACEMHEDNFESEDLKAPASGGLRARVDKLLLEMHVDTNSETARRVSWLWKVLLEKEDDDTLSMPSTKDDVHGVRLDVAVAAIAKHTWRDLRSGAKAKVTDEALQMAVTVAILQLHMWEDLDWLEAPVQPVVRRIGTAAMHCLCED